ncbi:MAG: alpha-mannosidase [Lentisphaerae bacterium]|nr:alpha-mannosidase [Lentisphaerota bacterium]
MTCPQTVHLICNAHLDPVWLWEWEEGAAATLATFRTAAELCEADDAFIFNHNEAILYEWVRRYDPALFARIRRLVRAGRWHIMGGWYLQPDCNMPSGESLVRQILLGRAFFKEHFGAEPEVAINFDPFGHSRGLVQILAKSGYGAYLFGRPQPHVRKLPAEDFTWVGFDGSEIAAGRFCGWYNTPLGRAAEVIGERIALHRDRPVLAVLWGVGNHGGGPSRKDLRDVNRLIARDGSGRIRHSTPEGYFRDLRRAEGPLPRHADDLNPWAVGCYTSQVRIKQQHRLLENEVFVAEKMAAAAALAGLLPYPRQDLRNAVCDLLMTEFHDILPGSSIRQVEEAALRQAGHGLEIASRVKARAFFALASGQRKARGGEIPILAYNPHPYPVRQIVICEFQLPDQNLGGGFHTVAVFDGQRRLPSQVEKEASTVFVEWRKRVVFAAALQPGMNRFDARLKKQPSKPQPVLRARSGRIAFRTRDLEVVINTRTGLMDRYRVRGADVLRRRSFELLVMRDDADPWGMQRTAFRDTAGRFRLMSREAGARFSGLKARAVPSVRVIEDGPVRSVVEAVLAYGRSAVRQLYMLPRRGTEIELQLDVYWQEKDRLLKWRVPTALSSARYLGQTAYGVQALPHNGTEAVAQKWTAVVAGSRGTALTCINAGSYGSDFADGTLRVSLLRSPAYAAHPDAEGVRLPPGRYLPRSDQGLRSFRFWFNAGAARTRLERVDREALARNEQPFVLPCSPPGGGRKPRPPVLLDDDVVQMTALKPAESNDDWIVRLFEPTGRPRRTILRLPSLGRRLTVRLNGFEIKTLRIHRRTGRIRETDLMEHAESGSGL